MELSHPGWLTDLLGRILAGYDPGQAIARMGAAARPEGGPARVRALRHAEDELRRSGMIYGSPRLPSRVTQGQRLDRAEAFFLAILSGEIFLALDVARIHGAPWDRQRAEVDLTLLLAAAIGRVDLAARIRRRARASASIDDLQEELARALLARQTPATGDTVFDLPLHDALVWSEARVLVRLAVDWYGRGRLDAARVRRLRAAAHRERAALLQALLALARAHHPITDAERRAVRAELRRLRLPREDDRRVREALERPLPPDALAARIRTAAARRFVLEQVYLAAIADETVDEIENRFLTDLRLAFGVGEEEMHRIATRVAEAFYDPTDVHDAFELRAAGVAAGERLVDRIARELEENLDRVVEEGRKTGDLIQLLGKAARGQRLSAAERARAREQLIELAKVVPSLAILSAPGGMLIFAALLKVLPANLLPAVFQRREERPPHRRPPRVPLASRPISRR